ncbi:hypothetical protein EYZ11_013294 [Aspergillus tanneri]|uniref:Uncharacterized protein n=1 Tax=Aspergillus tanneri TaxID=1220188 RepID=A0A4S3J3G1_9EURO|nr:hypothetical protein EYZ11_013294 [Aspergillus tanneri]
MHNPRDRTRSRLDDRVGNYADAAATC